MREVRDLYEYGRMTEKKLDEMRDYERHLEKIIKHTKIESMFYLTALMIALVILAINCG